MMKLVIFAVIAVVAIAVIVWLAWEMKRAITIDDDSETKERDRHGSC